MDNPSKQKPAKTELSSGTVFFVLVLLLSLVGLGVAVELTDIHHATHTDPDFKSVCAVSDEVNCETVARSPYSVFLGAPVSVWGIFGYVMLAFFALWGIKGPRYHSRFPVGILFMLVSAAVGASGVLGYISLTKIDSLCLFCLSLYSINTVLLLVTVGYLVIGRINPFAAFFADLRGFFAKKAMFGAVALPFVGAMLGIMFGISPYWQHVGWQEIPVLPTGVDPNGFHWTGAENPIITIVEYSDYQCPFCRKAHKEVRLSAAKFPKEVRLIHRHLPLDNACNGELDRPFHEFACEFAKAAECASEQKRFWAMNDALFSVQDTMKAEDVDVEILAVELGLDRSQFNECMAKPGYPHSIKADMADAKKLEIKGTPTFYVGVQPYEGRLPASIIEKHVENARKQGGTK